MKVTKYTHTCVVLEDQGQKVIIDPGEYGGDFGSVDNVAAVVITHNHADHFKPEHLQTIVAANPNVVVFTTEETAQQWGDPHAKVVAAYEDFQAGSFSFRFFGEEHAKVHGDQPHTQNTGVLVNNSFYYPGDSFVMADRDVQVLALPVSGPWMKLGEALDFLTATEPPRVFPTHNAPLSEIGQASADSWISSVSEHAHIQYTPLKVGDSFEY